MAITPEYLRDASAVVHAASSLREAATIWRAHDPAMRVVVVDALDMRDETPALRLGSRSVYLATSNGICWSLTRNAAEATALILAQD